MPGGEATLKNRATSAGFRSGSMKQTMSGGGTMLITSNENLDIN
jgi:hypothetical protein